MDAGTARRTLGHGGPIGRRARLRAIAADPGKWLGAREPISDILRRPMFDPSPRAARNSLQRSESGRSRCSHASEMPDRLSNSEHVIRTLYVRIMRPQREFIAICVRIAYLLSSAPLNSADQSRSSGVLTFVSSRRGSITMRCVSQACTSARMLRSPAATSSSAREASAVR